MATLLWSSMLLGCALPAVDVPPVAAPPASATDLAPAPSHTSPLLPTATRITPTATPDPRIEQWLANLTLEEKIGQMLLIGLFSPSVDNSAVQAATGVRVGGVWLTRRNLTSVEQTTALIAELQQLAIEQGSGLPMFVALDHEGGAIHRLPPPVTHWPSNMALAAAGCDIYAAPVGQAAAEELRALGFNLNFAPVLDLHSNLANPITHIRTFGSQPETAANCAAELITGYQSAGIIAVAKHFPGHGSTPIDSHAELPTIPLSLPDLYAADLQPFQAAIQADVGGMMVGHLRLPDLDPALPASLSPALIDGLLRSDLGYNGVVFTDDVAAMGAINTQYRIGPAAIRAIQAGADVIVMNAYYDSAQFVIDAVLRAIARGDLTEARLDQSVRRILALKAAYGLLALPLTAAPPANYPAHAADAEQVGAASVAAYPTAPALPLTGPVLLITPADRLAQARPSGNARSNIAVALELGGLTVTELAYNANTGATDTATNAMLSAASQTPTTVFLSWDAALGLRGSLYWQRRTISQLLTHTDRLIVVAINTPYDLAALPNVTEYLMTFGATDAQMQGLAAVLLGQSPITATLPFDPTLLSDPSIVR